MSRISFRELIPNMAGLFDANAGGNLVATAQFRASGKERGDYYLCIENGICTFNEDSAQSATVTIHTPSEVWVAINLGEMDGAQTFLQGKFHVEGDLNFLIRMRELFKRS